MTDNEIMNTVRRCADKACYRCTEYGKEHCRETIAALAWDMMYNLKEENKRQKAEIERLNVMIEAAEEHFSPLPFKNAFDEYIVKVKSEARKEFAEKLKNIYLNDKRYDRPNPHTLLIKLFDNIDNLLKEMEKEHD